MNINHILQQSFGHLRSFGKSEEQLPLHHPLHHPQWIKFRRSLWHIRGVLVTAPTVSAIVIGLRCLGWLQPLELGLLDQFFRFRPTEATDSRILIVGVDEADIQRLETWPTSDAVLAKALHKIRQHQPIAIGLDIYRDFPVPPGTSKLNQIFQTTPSLIGIEKRMGNNMGSAIKPPPILKRLHQVGVNDVVIDADGKQRRGLLYLFQDDAVYESLGLRLALMYLERQGIFPKPDAEHLTFGTTEIRPFNTNDGGYVRADDGGYQVQLNFRGPAESFETVSLTDILTHRVPDHKIRNRLVLIGVTAASINDRFYTPYSGGFVSVPEQTAGVEMHANLTSQLISTVMDQRPQIKTWADSWEWTWITGWATFGAVLSWKWRYVKESKHRLPTRAVMLAWAGTVLVGGCYGAFLQGWWLPVGPALLALSGSVIAVTSYMARSAADIRKTFGRYLTDEVVSRLLETPEGLKMGGERRQVTILMSDLRGFSAASERQSPEKVLAFLNRYLETMTDVITQYQGTIDEFMGDGILVMFGAPTQRPDDAERAIACGLAMQAAMTQVNQYKDMLGLETVEMGIGINTGEVVVGNIGSLKRAKYGIVGSQINLTARIESYTVGGQVLISDATRTAVGDRLTIGGLMQVRPKGFQTDITLYDVIGLTGHPHLDRIQIEDSLVPLPDPLSVQYTIVQDKQIETTIHLGKILQLAENSAEMATDIPLELFSNLQLTLLLDTRSHSGGIYAKVTQHLDTTTAPPYYVRLRFTFVPPDVRLLIRDAITAPIPPQD